MRWRSVVGAALVACLMGVGYRAAAQDQPAQTAPAGNAAAVRYLPMDAPDGMSQAVVVEDQPLVHTRQLLPLDAQGNVVPGTLDQQIEQVLNNLDAVLTAAGSGLNKLVRLNVYAIAPDTVDLVRTQLAKRLDPAVRPAITAVLTPMPRHKVLVAVDAVAVASDQGAAVVLKRCEGVAGDNQFADAAVLPRGGVAYVSGVPRESDVAVTAVAKSVTTLLKTLERLQLTPAHVVQLKVFLRPASSAEDVLRELKQFFPGQMTPPVVFVEWLAPPDVEIELIAQLPPAADKPADTVQYFTPPDVRSAPTFSRVALVRGQRQIYTSGLFAHKPGKGEEQVRDLFAQLQIILNETGSDMTHLAKASYFVCDADASRGFDVVRPIAFNPLRPPAASLVMVHGVGQKGRTLTMDIIAAGK